MRRPTWAVTHHIDELISLLASTRAFCTSAATILRGLIRPKVKKWTTGAFHDLSQCSASSKYFSVPGRSTSPATKVQYESMASMADPNTASKGQAQGSATTLPTVSGA